MSHHAPTVHAEWIGPMQTLYGLDAEGAPVEVGEVPAIYLQHRDDDGQVQNLPAGDLDDHTWTALSAEAQQVITDSGLYTFP